MGVTPLSPMIMEACLAREPRGWGRASLLKRGPLLVELPKPSVTQPRRLGKTSASAW